MTLDAVEAARIANACGLDAVAQAALAALDWTRRSTPRARASEARAAGLQGILPWPGRGGSGNLGTGCRPEKEEAPCAEDAVHGSGCGLLEFAHAIDVMAKEGFAIAHDSQHHCVEARQ